MNRLAFCVGISVVLVGCGVDSSIGDGPAPVPERVMRAIGDQIQGGNFSVDELAYRLRHVDDLTLRDDVTPASCDAVEVALASVCDDMWQAREVATCSYAATFFYAHDVPRCAVRFETSLSEEGGFTDVFAIDFSGTPLDEPAPTCGDGIVDEGEDCDDGNHESWDGCDANCRFEEFQGCEAVIESVYAELGIATVPQDTWQGPRTHVLTNSAVALQEVDSSLCNAAITAGQDVCDELSRQMDFVSYCFADGELFTDSTGPACAVRIYPFFGQVAPEASVFTTALGGLLTFTVR